MSDQPTQPAAAQQSTTPQEPEHLRRRPRPASSSQLNLPAMIDIIFLLLIYFVITANFMLDEGVLITKLPQGSGGATDSLAPPPEPLNIELTAMGVTGVGINVAGMFNLDSFTELAEQLETMQYDPQRQRGGMYKPDDPVIIKPQGDVRWQHAVNALNAAVKARFSNVRFAQATPR